LVISGREPVERTDPRWIREWDTAILHVDLEPFREHEVEAYLRDGPDTASTTLQPLPGDIGRALHVTGGLPVWLGLWRKNWLRGGEAPDIASAEDVQSVVGRFLMWWDDTNERRWVRTAWVPRWFNLEVLRVLLGSDAEAAFEWLTQQASIVRGVDGCWSFHQVVRSALRHEALQRTPGELAQVNDRLAQFWHARNSPSASAIQEEIYHELLGSEPSRGVASAYREYVRSFADEDALAAAAGVVGAVRAARADAGALVNLGHFDPLEEHWEAWRVEDQERQAAARERILGLDVLSPRERALLLADRVATRSGETVEPTAPSRGRALERSYRRRSWWSGVRIPGFRSARVAPPIAAADEAHVHALVEYGDALRLAGALEDALKPLGEAIALDPRHAHAWASRGETRRVLGQTMEAIDDLCTAVRLAPHETWMWVARATAYLVAQMPSKALADADRALALDNRSAWALATRGAAIARLTGYLAPEAAAALTRALELDPSLSWAQRELTFWESATHPEPTDEAD
jgi:tetratricopeptide (TPR) repeat protein